MSTYIMIYLKKREKIEAVLTPGNQSLHKVGVRKDSEREVLNVHCILLLGFDKSPQCV